MKQLLILSTIVLLFVFTNQGLPPKRNYTKTFNHSRIFNYNCPTGYFRNVHGICVKKPLNSSHVNKGKFQLKNYTSCPIRQKLSCFKSRVSNKTYCICINATQVPSNPNIGRYNGTYPICRPGNIRRCRYDFKLRKNVCRCEKNINYFNRTYTGNCSPGFFYTCTGYGRNRRCNCQRRKQFPNRHA